MQDPVGTPTHPVRSPAVFLDRDGCVIVEKEYLSDPEAVELIPGAVEGLRRLAEAGFRLVLVSNQSGVARGYFTEDDVRAVNERLRQLLSAEGVLVDASYYSPYHPDGTVPDYRKVSPCRKPAPGMLLRAAEELSLDLKRSFMVGDKLSDLDAAAAAGVTGLLVLTGYGSESLRQRPDAPHVESLADAADWILS